MYHSRGHRTSLSEAYGKKLISCSALRSFFIHLSQIHVLLSFFPPASSLHLPFHSFAPALLRGEWSAKCVIVYVDHWCNGIKSRLEIRRMVFSSSSVATNCVTSERSLSPSEFFLMPNLLCRILKHK